jgi:hypothetical protein
MEARQGRILKVDDPPMSKDPQNPAEVPPHPMWRPSQKGSAGPKTKKTRFQKKAFSKIIFHSKLSRKVWPQKNLGPRSHAGRTFPEVLSKSLGPIFGQKSPKSKNRFFGAKIFKKVSPRDPYKTWTAGKKLRGRRPPRGTQLRRNESAASHNNLTEKSRKVSRAAESHAQPVCPGKTQKCPKGSLKMGLSSAAVSKPRRPPSAERH